MKKQLLLWGIGLTYAALFLTSCREKKDDTPGVASTGAYVLSVRSEGSSSVSTEYLTNVDNVKSGEISIVGKGIEQTNYHHYQQTGKYLTTITYTDVNTGTIYKMNENKQLVQHKKFTIDRLHLFHPISDVEFLAINIPFKVQDQNFGTIFRVNAETGSVIMQGKVNLYTPTNHSGEQAVFSGMALRGNKLYLPFFHISDGKFNSTYTDTAYVAIYSWPDLTYEKRIVDSRTGFIGSYCAAGHIFTTENDDIYTVSPCSFSTGASQETKQSGILRIKAGQTEFDKDYFVNIEELSGGYKINSAYYLGNNKMLASIFTTHHTIADRWARADVKLAIIDIAAKTLNYVNGVPVHYGGVTGMYPNHFMIDNEGKLQIKIKSAEGLYMYEVDPNTYTGIRGAKIIGQDVMHVANLK